MILSTRCALVAARRQVDLRAKKKSNVSNDRLSTETDPIMASGRRAILALDATYDKESDFVGILGGNNNTPRVIQGYPVYRGIKRIAFR